jgi:hypothetical protein
LLRDRPRRREEAAVVLHRVGRLLRKDEAVVPQPHQPRVALLKEEAQPLRLQR